MMVWVNAIAILVSAYVFAYGLVRVAAIVLPRLLPAPVSPLPMGVAVSTSVIGFCMVTGTPGPVIFGMILIAIAATRYALIGASGMHRLAILVAAILAGSVFYTHQPLHMPSVPPYLAAAIAAVAIAVVVMMLDQSEALAKTALVAASIALLIAPVILPAPYHVMLDGALVLLGMAAFGFAARHIRPAVTLDRAFTLPATVLVVHSVLVTLVACMKGL